jgi:hypothetical protein
MPTRFGRPVLRFGFEAQLRLFALPFARFGLAPRAVVRLFLDSFVLESGELAE